ncbi:uncharacterized protein [Argopecten irradians]|uniref:uncharacterized protein n=1 Tax=Argopecten irradians TaxID=31199 RepID=UPI00371EE375
MASKSVFRAQIPIRVKGSVSCAHHHGIEVSLCCRQCSELACIRCIASVHDGHDLDDLSEAITTKKSNIRSFILRIEKNDIVELKTEVGSISQKIEENERTFQKHQNELEKQGNRMKEEIDIIIKKSVSTCSQLKQENERRFEKYKADMKTRIEELTKLVERCRKTLETDDNVEIFDTEKELDLLPAVELNLCSMNFTPNQHPQGYLDLAKGRITFVGYQGQLTNVPSIVDVPSVDENDISNAQVAALAQCCQLKEIKQRKALYNVSAICATKAGGAWICSSEVSSIYQFDNSILGRRNEDCKVRVNDISISPVTGNVWASSEDNNAIMEITSQGNSVKRFSTSSSPRCLCVTRGNKIIVGMDRELVCCDAQDGDIELNRYVHTPTKVAVCPVTESLAVVVLDFYEHGGEGKPHILVLDKMLKERRRFYSETEGKGTSAEVSISSHPSDVTFDSVGNLLVGDYGNKSILILNTTGGVVRSIYSDTWHVVALSVNSKNVVWAVVKYRDYPNYKIKVLNA